MNKLYVMNKSYKEDNLLRRSFNELAKEIYGLDFEDWYQKGYWRDNYIPYSMIENNKVVANASVNIMNFDYLGEKKKYIQIGTVMTNKAYRNKGLSKILLKEIIKDYTGKVDGFFLFANDNVLEFYPKFGFRKSTEYQYSKSVQNIKEERIIHIPMNDQDNRVLLEEAIIKSANHSIFEMKHNVGLIMFYATQFMKDNVFYIENQNAYVIAEINGEHLVLFHVFSSNTLDINQIIEAFGNKIKTVTLGFTPIERNGFTISEINKEDTTLFLLGKDFDNFEQDKIMFPILGHA